MPSEFPNFEPLSIGHRAHIEAIARQFDPYSDFNFASLFSWNNAGGMATCMLNGNLVVRFSDYITGEPFYSFLGTNATEDTATALLGHMKKEGIEPVIKLLPWASLGNIHPDKFRIEEDPDNHDYVLSIERMKTFAGNRLRSKRNFVARFLRSHRSETRILDLSDLGTQDSLKDFFLGWAKRKGCPATSADAEFRAMSQAMELSAIHPMIGIGVYVDGELAGFTINERLHGAYGMLHFEKADPERFVGVYQYLMQETARLLSATGCEYLNYQQDLGIPGLKKCKKEFLPHAYLRKYRVSWIEKMPCDTMGPSSI